MPSRKVLVVEAEGEGLRLDAWLAPRLDLSRTRVAQLLAEGNVRLNGEVPRKSEALTEGDQVEVDLPPARPSELVAEAIPLDILYEDPHLLVLNKAAGMVVHPAPGHPTGTLVNALLHHVKDLGGIGGTLRPGIVHRLDRDTSGLLVVAKTEVAHKALSFALKERKVRRLYLALAWGHLTESHLRIEAPIGRDPRDRKKMAIIPEGRRAVTRVRIRERWRSAELLDVALETGRTHQIRVHLAHLGHPIVGDTTYGANWDRGMGGRDALWARELARKVPRQFLHAAKLAFEHPVTGATMRFETPLPPDLEAVAHWARDAEEWAPDGEGRPEGSEGETRDA